MYLTVVTSSKSAGIGNGLTYETTNADVKIGSPVRVPLRRKLVEGIVVEISQKKLQTEFDLRSIKEVIGEELLTDAQIKTIRWMADYYCCSLRHALQVWLPSPPWARLLPTEVSFLRAKKSTKSVRGEKQIAILECLEGKDWMEKTRVMEECGANAATLKRLLEQGILEEKKERMTARVKPSIPKFGVSPQLSPDQKRVLEEINKEPKPTLLFGITSSGKTEIYVQLITQTIQNGKQALLLVPEILLTEHIIDRFTQLLPRECIAIMHSRLKPSERRNEWQRIHQGEVSLVIGSRSALFSPLKNLGLVILDEEHEWTYKNEQTPRYHARDTAQELCRNGSAKLVLGSATPSLESWVRAKTGQYQLARLPERFGNGSLPKVEVIDLADVAFGKLYPFSPALIEAIKDRLGKNEQIVLFLNHRGVASALLCLQCRRRVTSPDSLLPFTVHEDGHGAPYLMDHSTGLKVPTPATCPHCGSARLHEVGAGTQGIEQMLKGLFPKARSLRADSDTLEHPEQMRALLSKMRNGEADILLGTQSVVKGLDLPNVTLAVVLIADIGMSLPHFRAGERSFQLLTQLTGRSGRAKPGEVIIQTFRPDSPEVKAASNHDAEKYLEDELRLRIHAGYPPATQMIRLLFRGPDAHTRAKIVHADALSVALRTANDAKISLSPTLFGGNREWHILLRGTQPRALLKQLKLQDVIVDVDPVETL